MVFSIPPNVVQVLRTFIPLICVFIIGDHLSLILRDSKKIKGRENFIVFSLATTIFVWAIIVISDEGWRITIGFCLLILNLFFIAKEYRKKSVPIPQEEVEPLEDRTDNLIQKLDDLQNQNFKFFIFNVWKGRSPPSGGFHGMDEEGNSKPYSSVVWKNKMENFLTKMNDIGYSYCEENIDHDKVVDLRAPLLIKSWYLCEKFINSKRETEEGYQKYFEKMFKDIEKRYKKRSVESYEKLKRDIKSLMKK